VQAADEKYYECRDYITTSPEMPPLASTNYTALDDGNCNPKYMRSTLYSVPTTGDLLNASKLPFGMVLQPFADIKDTEVKPILYILCI
jgi:protein transport protein SEC24